MSHAPGWAFIIIVGAYAGSFADLAKLKGGREIGDKINIIIGLNSLL